MKQLMKQKTIGFFLGSFMVLSLSNCTKSATSHDEEMAVNPKMNGSSLNLKKEFKASISSLNNSGVSGMATLWLEGNKLTVKIEASGLEENKIHPQHIHGFKRDNRNSTCPTMAADVNGDGLVDLAEGLPSYGPVLLDLAPTPIADEEGNITYMQTFEISKELLPLQNRAIVLHGLTVNNEYMATLPVACGQIQSW